MSDFDGLPIITSPNLPEGTVLVVNPDFLMPHFDIGPISGPFITEGEIHFTWKPLSQLRTPTGWTLANIYGASFEPVKYRGLARITHALRRLWARFR